MALLNTVISGITIAASFRRIGSYTGPCCRVLRDSDDATQDFGFTGSGLLDVAAIETWLGSAHGYLTRWYLQDSSGTYFEVYGARIAVAGVVDVDGDNRPRIYFDGYDDYAVLRNQTINDIKSLHLLAEMVTPRMFVNYGTDAFQSPPGFYLSVQEAITSTDSGLVSYGGMSWGWYSGSPAVLTLLTRIENGKLHQDPRNGTSTVDYTVNIYEINEGTDPLINAPFDRGPKDLFIFINGSSSFLTEGYLSEIILCSGRDNTTDLADIVSNMLGDWPPIESGSTEYTVDYDTSLNVSKQLVLTTDYDTSLIIFKQILNYYDYDTLISISKQITSTINYDSLLTVSKQILSEVNYDTDLTILKEVSNSIDYDTSLTIIKGSFIDYDISLLISKTINNEISYDTLLNISKELINYVDYDSSITINKQLLNIINYDTSLNVSKDFTEYVDYDLSLLVLKTLVYIKNYDTRLFIRNNNEDNYNFTILRNIPIERIEKIRGIEINKIYTVRN